MYLKSSTEKDHYHVVLSANQINPQLESPERERQVTVGYIDDHTHEWEFNPQTGVMFLLPANGHTHSLTLNDVLPEKPLEKESHEKRIDECTSKLKSAMEYESTSFKTAKKAYKYYEQEQWEETDKSYLDKANRPALQYDQIGPNVDKIVGYHTQNLPDPAVYPVTKDDQVMVDIVSQVVKQILTASDYETLAETVFQDEYVAGRGIWDLYMDFTHDIGGDIKIRYIPYNMMITGPHVNKDLSDCEDMFGPRLVTENMLKMEFPDTYKKAKEGSERGKNMMEILSENYEVWIKAPGAQYEPPAGKPLGSKGYSETLKDRYMVIDWFRKAYFKEYIFAGFQGNEPPIRMKASDAKQLKEMGVPNADRIAYSIEKVVVCNGEELASFDTGFNFFPYTIAYGKKGIKGWRGKVAGAIDMQDECNKRISQTTDIVNKMAGYNWFFDGETFESPEQKRKFLSQSSQPGSGFEIANVERPPIKTEGVKFPAEVINLDQNAMQRMDMYFGGVLNAQDSSKLGSRGMLLQQRVAMLINEVFFNHYNRAFIQLTKKIIRFVQKFYSPQKILRIIRSAPQTDEDLAYNQVEDLEILKLLATNDFLMYDAAVDVKKNSPTFREAQFELMTELSKQGLPLPPEVLIESSSFPNKRSIMRSLEQQGQAQAQAQQQQNASEVIKSVIGKVDRPEIINAMLQAAGVDISQFLPQPQTQQPQLGPQPLPPAQG